MKNKVSITVNGVERYAEVEPRMLLVHFLREELHLTGTHVGCDTTQCGACTVRMNEQAVKSCTVFAVQADGANITTVEGLAGGEALHPIQEAFREHHGLQCGFCTSGMMMAASQLLDRYPEPTLEQIKHQLDGNICRCTGYHNIIKAVQSAAERIKARKQAQGAR
ncbi:MAG: (2Fe-2S)-binding protein [Xanthobacteraceae bacterium]|nr:(2Fe-2S)-binding protein [Xanthobacteraceae bacterium]